MTRLTAMLVATSLSLAAPLQAFSYDTQLDSQAVREAYFLGRRSDQTTNDFLDAYIKHLAIPEHGPYISYLALYTPYAQLVLNSWINAMGYSSQQAERDYLAGGDVVRVRVRIEFTPTYTAVLSAKPGKNSTAGQAYAFRPEDFWREFQFELRQDKGPIKPRVVKGAPVYDDGGFLGAEVWLEYEAKEVKSEETAMEVRTPDGQRVIAKFDLSKLR